MKILHINKSDIIGGAAIAGYRLHQGLLAHDVDSYMLVDKRKLNDIRVEKIKGHRCLDGVMLLIGQQIGLNYLLLLRGLDLYKHSLYKIADVINLHNLHNGYFNYITLPRIASSKPVVYTLHDMWSFTGHCAYSYDCEKWITGCGSCPYPDTYPRIRLDNTRIEWKLKRRVYSKCNLNIVTPSRWLARLASKSMLKDFPIHHIPNGLNIDVFQPYEKKLSRDRLGIKASSNVLMFAAENLTDPRKGSELLHEAITGFPDDLKRNTIILTFGKSGGQLPKIGMQTIELGYIEDDAKKVLAFSAADIFVFPSLADNLPLVLQESMACGTPMVAFDVGGIPELVRPGITGYLAKKISVSDFRNMIISLLIDKTKRNYMTTMCRKIAVDEYSIEKQVNSYLRLYNKLINEHEKNDVINVSQ